MDAMVWKKSPAHISRVQREKAMLQQRRRREALGLPEPTAYDRKLRRARNVRYAARKNGENVPKLPPGRRSKSSEKQAEDKAA